MSGPGVRLPLVGGRRTAAEALPGGLPIAAGWVLGEVVPEAARLSVTLRRGDETVTLTVSPPEGDGDSGPFDAGGLRVCYQPTASPFPAFAPAARALVTHLLACADGDAPGLIRSWLAPAARPRSASGGGASSSDGPEVIHFSGDVEALRVRLGTSSRPVILRARVSTLRSGEVVAALSRFADRVVLSVIPDGDRGSSSWLDDVSHLTVIAGTLRSASLRWAPLLPLDRALLDASATASGPLRALGQAIPGATVELDLPVFHGRIGEFRAAVPSLPSLRAALPRLAELGLTLRLAPDATVPLCIAGALERAAPQADRPDRAFAPICSGCTRREQCAGLPEAYLSLAGSEGLAPFRDAASAPVSAGPVDEASWMEAARRILVDQPRASLTLDRIIPRAQLPPWACVDPWTRLEYSTSGTVGPCCSDYQMKPARPPQRTSAAEDWNGPAMRGFRRAMAQRDITATCTVSCPELVGAFRTPAHIELLGGKEVFVEAQLRLVAETLAGAETMQSGPLVLCFPTTTYCNYDCLMCSFGVEGTLDDEKPASFYESLARFAPGLQRLEILGGEPLASPVFREWLKTEDFSRYPGLGITLITNGSYLSPAELVRLRNAPLRDLVVSINAATPETYLAVNRGLPWERVRANLDHLRDLRRDGAMPGSLMYSMVLLKRNVDEIGAFAELARRDGASFRFMLPNQDRNQQSIMTDRASMELALASLEEVLAEETRAGRLSQTRQLLGEVGVLSQRLSRGVLRPLPERA